jgi:hypothetical protein
MINNLSLMSIMSSDPDLAKRLEQGTKEVRESKANLMDNAAAYTEIYAKEIEEGTRQRQLLLENGQRMGQSEEEVLKAHGKFLPCRQTPIMNFLYFFMRDGAHPDWMGIHKKMNKSYGHVNEKVDNAVTETELEAIFGHLVHEEEKYESVREPREMETFIYGNMSHAMFVKIKKLKALSKSPNQNEAFLAYRLCLKLCAKYGLEFDKIPCVVDNPNEKYGTGVWG